MTNSTIEIRQQAAEAYMAANTRYFEALAAVRAAEEAVKTAHAEIERLEEIIGDGMSNHDDPVSHRIFKLKDGIHVLNVLRRTYSPGVNVSVVELEPNTSKSQAVHYRGVNDILENGSKPL